MPRITQLRRFPLKGAASLVEEQLSLNTRIGVENDRRIALRHRPGEMTRRAEKHNKFDYVVGANTAVMAKERPVFADAGAQGPLDPGYLAALTARLPHGDAVQVQDSHGEYHIADTDGPQVSFLNLATLRALEAFAGVPVDPERFRMNVWMEGLPAFAEYDWVDRFPGTREILVGPVRMRVDDACERCKAPHANPATGEYDMNTLPLLMAFMEQRGYRSPHRGVTTVMGIFAEVLHDGVIRLGDDIRLL